MKRLILLIICSIWFSSNGTAQDFRSALKDKNANYKQIKATLKNDTSLFNTLSDKDLIRFNRWDWYWRSRVDSSGSFEKLKDEMIKYSEISIKESISIDKKSASSFTWESLGPHTRPSGNGSGIGQGLVATIWVHPTDFDTILIGASNGGLWKTENGGTNWSCLTERVLLGGITDIAVHPTNNDIIYVTTQVRAANGSHLGIVSQYSLGLFKTINGGSSWSKLNTSSIPNEDIFQRVLIHPTNPNTVYALTLKGIYKSTNSGTTWTSIGPYLTSGDNYYEMEFKPNDPNTIYVSGSNTLEKTSNGGSTWTSIIGNLVNVFNNARIAIAVDINNPNYIYALYSDIPDGYYADVGLELSTNGGSSSSWTVKQTHGTLLDAAGFLTKIWVSPDGDVFAGGIQIKKSSNKGSTFGSFLTTGNIHADIRDLYFPDPNNPNIIYAATDGGVYMDDQDGSSWSRITGDLALNEFYSVGITKQNSEVLTGGSQDCGSVKRNSDGSWTQIGDGDGGVSLIDQTNHNIYYYTINKNLYSSSTGYIGNGGYYDSHVNMDPTDTETMYRSEWDTITNPPVKLIKTTDRWSSTTIDTRVWEHIWDMTICESEQNAYYFTTYDLWSTAKIFNCPNGGNSCSQVSYTGISDIVQIAPATEIVVHPFNKNIAWVTFGGFESGKKVYLTTNGGSSWTNHTYTGLPNLPIQCLEYDFLNEIVIIGTDVGAFFKSVNGNSWELAGDLPEIMITKLVINKSSGDLIASTFGRGMYRTSLGNGYCNDEQNPLTINTSTTWSTDNEICSAVTIASGGTLNVQATITMGYNSTITVQNNGLLKIDSGKIVNGKIIVQSGGSLEVLNGGVIDLNYEDHLQIDSGGSLQFSSGEIMITSEL
jgi:photosystem II stability/assembly factor-like uncharacterized protein